MDIQGYSPHTEKHLGFSLVELLVVLLLMGLVASLAFPRIQSTLLAFERDAMEDTLFIFLRQQIAHSNATGLPFTITKGSHFSLVKNENSGRIDLEFQNAATQPSSNLHYRADSKVYINTQGMCANTQISLVFESVSRPLFLKQPFCQKALVND